MKLLSLEEEAIDDDSGAEESKKDEPMEVDE